MIEAIDHIGIAVISLDSALPIYRVGLGLIPSAVEEIPSQMVRAVFFNIGTVRLELLEATSEESPIAIFIKKHGPGIHHIAFRTTKINADLETAKSSGLKVIYEVPFIGAHNMLVSFLHPKSTGGVLIELCQGNKK
jgi:methylmalonyl-CoA epimerase